MNQENRTEIIPILKQEHLIELLSKIIDVLQEDKVKEVTKNCDTFFLPHTSNKNIENAELWKQNFLTQLNIPIEIKEMLGLKRK